MGFNLIEFVMVLAFLTLQGLLIAFVCSLFTGPAPWYAWVIAALMLPGEAIALGVAGITVGSIADRRAARMKA